MRLSSIKISGFKSFVDNVVINFNSNLTAVVGPNGCGKSNVIDAVRWVMGESSAKNLRGETLTDVIFNGSLNRLPAKSTTVELIFDKISKLSKYADFNEISIKRHLKRNGDNEYYINNNKCRRKDIIDIFQGTGVGSKGYSIIEQGMIARIVESDAQSLQYFVDEAAGVSKYKDRKKETERKLHIVEENILRISDIQQLLLSQIEKLEIQADNAREHTNISAELKDVFKKISAIKINESLELLDKNEQLLTGINEQANNLQDNITQLIQKRDHLHNEERSLQAQVHILYSENLKLTGEINTKRQNIFHFNERIKQLTEEQKKLTINVATFEQEITQIKQAKTDLQELELQDDEVLQQQYKEVGKSIAQLDQSLKENYQSLQLLQQQKYVIQRTIDAKNLAIKVQQEVLDKVKIAEVFTEDQKIATLTQQLSELMLNIDLNVDICDEIKDNKESLQVLLNNHQQQLTMLLDQKNSLTLTLQEINANINALNALQTKTYKPYQKFADTINFHKRENLAEYAVFNYLDSYICDKLPSISEILSLDASLIITEKSEFKWLDIFSCVYNLEPLMCNNFYANTLEEAMNIVEIGQQYITEDGFLVSKNFIQPLKNNHILANKKKLANFLFEAEIKNADLQKLLSEINQKQEQVEKSQEQLQHESTKLKQIEQTINNLSNQKIIAENELIFLEKSKYNFLQTSQLKKREQEQAIEIINSISTDLLQEQFKFEDLEEKIVVENELIISKNDKITLLKKQAEDLKDSYTNSILEQQNFKHKKEAILTNLQNKMIQLDNSKQHLSVIAESLFDYKNNLEISSKAQELLIIQEKEVSLQLHNIKNLSQNNNNEFQEINLEVLKLEKNIKELETEKTNILRDKTKAEIEYRNLSAKLAEEDLTQEDIQNIEIAQSKQFLEQKYKDLNKKLQSLGPVNFTALAEHEEQLKKYNNLDTQKQDLEHSLALLYKVVQKLEKEMSNQFQKTFIEINQNLAEFFKKIFNGGNAYLSLNDDGISFMANPPGKKNSSIHLLSGGEKALTAIALIFAIFALNPAPFCMLDEVDAPLDDYNVARYIEIVLQMSQTVQFIYITHNKIAMEKAYDLVGVTMVENGISNIVNVNLENALKWSEKNATVIN